MIKNCVALSLMIVAAVTNVYGQPESNRVKQPAEVVEAYQVCTEFQKIFAENLDFGRAFEATFTKDPARRRAIAVAESQLGNIDLAQVGDATLISIYKDQMQLFYLLVLIAGTANEVGRGVILPPSIQDIFNRVRAQPQDPKQIPLYAAQLARDVVEVRAHLVHLVANYPPFAFVVQKFKENLLMGLKPPDSYVVKPLTSYSKGRVLGLKEKYYQIEDYAVIRENGRMKIIGIRFFSRLF
jgi:hypothetical protein